MAEAGTQTESIEIEPPRFILITQFATFRQLGLALAKKKQNTTWIGASRTSRNMGDATSTRHWKCIEQPNSRLIVLDRARDNRVFAVTLLRIRAAYALGAMRYGVFTALKPHDA